MWIWLMRSCWVAMVWLSLTDRADDAVRQGSGSAWGQVLSSCEVDGQDLTRSNEPGG